MQWGDTKTAKGREGEGGRIVLRDSHMFKEGMNEVVLDVPFDHTCSSKREAGGRVGVRGENKGTNKEIGRAHV